ncbi:SpoIIE family protein phosphatase [Desulfobotulus sp. H1]|uniref:SpoIIE family protein phosphatase n=1 Tax=Desulfobotulus pelophilus TaxID=2823377 RepID=A0ABT3NAD2_9BACT|nr:response regulator [Desulfobotulus pelophilus]MCW7754413.1 SpoIIE family protein phosphatase [Desulfobotulus pelophilus]
MGAHILIAEDENHTRLGLSLILRKAGYKVSLAEDGLAALAILRKTRRGEMDIDLFLTDVQMPGLTGLELLEAMKREDIFIPVVAITGYGDKDMVVSLMRRGCRDYLDKPFTPDEVQTCIASILERHRSDRATRLSDGLRERDMDRLRMDLASRRKQIEDARKAHASLTRQPTCCTALILRHMQHAYAEAGGDFLSFREDTEGWDVLIADVAGHDMGASYHTILLKAFFDEHPERNGTTFFHALNTHLTSSGNDRMITGLFLRMSLPAMRLEVCNAAHPSPILMEGKTGRILPLRAAGDSIGLWPDAVFHPKNYPVAPGDRILLFTDGIIQAKRVDGPTGKKENLGEQGILFLAEKHRDKTLDDFLSALWKDIMAFCRNKPADDMLLAVVDIPGSSRST